MVEYHKKDYGSVVVNKFRNYLSESYPNLSGFYTYDGRGSVSAVLGSFGDYRATYWYDGLGNVKKNIYGYGVFGDGKKYFGYNAEQYNPVTGNLNLRNRQVNIRRQRFLTEDTYLGNLKNQITLNRYIYGNDNPLKFKDQSGFESNVINTITGVTTQNALNGGNDICGRAEKGQLNDGILSAQDILNNQIISMVNFAKLQVGWDGFLYNNWYDFETINPWCSMFVLFQSNAAGLADDFHIMKTTN